VTTPTQPSSTQPDPLRPARLGLLREIRGQALRSYRVATVRDVDRNLRGLSAWLTRNLSRAPEFAWDYYARYLADVDLLLDRRLELMPPRVVQRTSGG
jgi:hypothetical protein